MFVNWIDFLALLGEQGKVSKWVYLLKEDPIISIIFTLACWQLSLCFHDAIKDTVG